MLAGDGRQEALNIVRSLGTVPRTRRAKGLALVIHVARVENSVSAIGFITIVAGALRRFREPAHVPRPLGRDLLDILNW
jgi:hypothetical protein